MTPIHRHIQTNLVALISLLAALTARGRTAWRQVVRLPGVMRALRVSQR